MMFRKKRVLVVGGKGFIGSHLKGYETLDLKDGQDVRNGITGKYDTIVFLAVDMGQTQKAYRYNATLYLALCHYVNRHPKTHVIYTSSAAVYPDNVKGVEDMEPNPPNLYGASKLLGEQHVKHYKKYTILRLSNVYGTGGKGAIDLFRAGRSSIYGDGNQVRDYVSVERVTATIRKAIEKPKKWQGIVNVSRGEGMTTRQAFKLYGTAKRPRYHPARKGDVQYSVLDNSKWWRLYHG